MREQAAEWHEFALLAAGRGRERDHTFIAAQESAIPQFPLNCLPTTVYCLLPLNRRGAEDRD
jgi:hypothetical protein